jgi:polysaccharide biosynthesis transport protein
MNVGDIYYVVFRHKWKIILLSLAGIAAATAVYFHNPPPYQSQAELLIQYVPQPAIMPLTCRSPRLCL